nr:hypothetical protein [Paracoccus saliphilus]
MENTTQRARGGQSVCFGNPTATDPSRPDLAWQLGLDEEVTDARSRMQELGNFLAVIEEGKLR